MNVQELIAQECDAVKALLLAKNADYGSSFAEPIAVFARDLTAEQQVNVRIDDKLKRLQNRAEKTITEDTEQDLIGYLVLKRVLRRMEAGR